MGREGFEPSTLGLRVRSDRRRRAATSCNELHRDLQQVATNYGRCGKVETNLYAQTYAQIRRKDARAGERSGAERARLRRALLLTPSTVLRDGDAVAVSNDLAAGDL